MINLINKDFTYALVGASNNPEKFGNIIFKDLMKAGYNVIPVNPREKEIEGRKAYKTVSEIPNKVDVVIFVVPPKTSLEILQKEENAWIKKVWFQPGSESAEVISFCEKNEIDNISNACIMVEKKK